MGEFRADNLYKLNDIMYAIYYHTYYETDLYSFLIFLIILSTYLQIIIGYERLPYQWNTLADVTGVYFNSGILGCQIAIAMLSVLILIYTGV